MRVLGIDPGSRLLGYGVVEKHGNRLSAGRFGTLRFDTKVDANLRLLEIFTSLRELVQNERPDAVAIEKVFFAKNAGSALKLGQARGVVILAIAEAGIPLTEYSPNEIKLATVGFGHATKDQVASMVARLLGLHGLQRSAKASANASQLTTRPAHPQAGPAFSSSDASDALAIAICHCNSVSYQLKTKL